jgi:hypothetical protein
VFFEDCCVPPIGSALAEPNDRLPSRMLLTRRLEDQSVPDEVDELSSGESAARQRPRWSPELLVEDKYLVRRTIVPPAMPAAN